MSEIARRAAEEIKAIAPLDLREAAKQYLSNESDPDKYALNVEATETIIDQAIAEATAELRGRLAECERKLGAASEIVRQLFEARCDCRYIKRKCQWCLSHPELAAECQKLLNQPTTNPRHPQTSLEEK